MPTHAELASKLLSDAAGFFRTLAEQNEDIKDEMNQNANVFDQMAALLTQNPEGVIDDKTHAQLAGSLLNDAAAFFRTLGEQNEPLKEQMDENANVYEQIGGLVEKEPLGELD